MYSLNRQLGFAVGGILIVVTSLSLVLAAGWLMYTRNNDKPDVEQGTSISSFEECVAAGNPVMESYPEQCMADGQSFTRILPENSTSDTLDKDWLTYTPESKRYSIRLPDGWIAVTLNGNLYVRDADKLVYTVGKTATVTPVEGGWDGGSPFGLYDPGSYADQIVREGTEKGTFTTDQGLVVHKYVYNQTTEPEAIGYPVGSKVYNYYFDANGKNIQVSHMITPGSADQSEWVEKAIKTITVN